jgi:hypothetical protein
VFEFVNELESLNVLGILGKLSWNIIFRPQTTAYFGASQVLITIGDIAGCASFALRLTLNPHLIMASKDHQDFVLTVQKKSASMNLIQKLLIMFDLFYWMTPFLTSPIINLIIVR